MAMLYDDRLDREDLKRFFKRAAERNQRYVAIVEQISESQYVVMVSEGSFITNDAQDVVRHVRERGMRPDSDRTVLRRIFDTRGEDFDKQVNWSLHKMLHKNLPEDARIAYERYLEARAKMDAANELPSKGGIARWFGLK